MKTACPVAPVIYGDVGAQGSRREDRVLGYVPLVENMPSGSAIRPGDVLKMRNGMTVEVLNTDAEGRLILADALSYAVDEKPDAIVDLATLTGACVVALGDKVAGLMGSDEGWIEQVDDAAGRVSEAWHLPLPQEYRSRSSPKLPTCAHRNGGYGGANRRPVPQGVRRGRRAHQTSRTRGGTTAGDVRRAAPGSVSAP